MDIQESIEFVNDYFVSAIKQNAFEIQTINNYSVEIKTNSGHEFSLWIANTAQFFRCYTGSYNKMQLEFTVDEKMELHMKFRKIFDDKMLRPDEIAKRKAEYLKLKEEFETPAKDLVLEDSHDEMPPL